MDLPNQSPPNASASLKTETSPKSRRTTIRMAVAVLLLLTTVSLSLLLYSRNNSYTATSVFMSNAREIHRTLGEFHGKYGGYPDSTTIPLVIGKTGTKLSLGTRSSNDYFRQLIAAGADERMFYSASRGFHRPDGRIQGKDALEKGECGFAYVLGIDATDENPAPLLIGPTVPGEKTFSKNQFFGKVFVCWTDGSVVMTGVGTDGTIGLGGGTRIDPAHPIWRGKPITIAWPE